MTQPLPAPTFDVSLVLVLRGDAGDGERSLVQLLQASEGPSFELLVVDDACSRTPPLLAQLAGDVQVWRHERPLGLAASRNAAAARARGRYLAFVEGHLLVTDGWLSALVALLETEPALAAAGGRTFSPAGAEQPLGQGFASAAGLARAHGELEPFVPSRLDRRSLPALGDGYLLVRADDFAALEGFDTRFRGRAGLLELCLRLHGRGRGVGHQPFCEAVAGPAPEAAADLALDAARLRRHYGVSPGGPDALWVEGRSTGKEAPAPSGAPGHFCEDPTRRPPPFVEVGRGTYFVSGTRFLTWTAEERIRVGSYCSFARDVTVLTGGGHSTDTVSTYPFENKLFGAQNPTRSSRSTRDTVIGSDVWVGDGVVVSGGVQVGHGAVLATGSVVFSDVPPYAVVAGNPARVLRYRFSDTTVAALLRIAWWEWPEEEIRRNVEWFFRPIADFVARFDPAAQEEASRGRATEAA